MRTAPKEFIESGLKNGNLPPKTKPVGAERLYFSGPHEWQIKVAMPNVWRSKKDVMYERYHNVKLGPNDKVIFVDGDKDNFEKDNLKLVKGE